MIFLKIFITNGNFLSWQGQRKLREVAELKCYVVHLEQEGFQELELAMAGIPACQLVDLMTAGVHKAKELAPLSSGTSSPSVEPVGSPFFGSFPKDSPSCLHLHNVSGPKGGGGNSAGSAPSHGPHWGHFWPLGKLSASGGAPGGTSHPLSCPSTHTSHQILQVS